MIRCTGLCEVLIPDIHAVLAIEPANGIAKEEQTELEDLQLKELSSREAEIRVCTLMLCLACAEYLQKPKELPPSPPHARTTELPSGRLSATIEEISDSPNVIEPVKEIDTSLKHAETARSSFADLKKGRQAKKTFTKPTSPTPLTAVPTEVSPLSPSALPLEQVTISTPPLAPTSATISTRSHLSSESLALLDPTMPGSALSLISAIRTHTAETTWPVIADLSKQPATLGKMLDNFLEPDQLALILTRLRESLDSASVQEERKKVIVDFVAGLRMTRRWSMTAMMLSSEEKQLGQEVWTIAGGTGDWAKRT